MADVRALLRAERAARATAKAESRNQPSHTSQGHGKKRKAIEADEDARKRTKGAEDTAPHSDANDEPLFGVAAEQEAAEQEAEEETIEVAAEQPLQPSMPTTKEVTVDEDEWAAFERDMATPPPPVPAQTALDAIRAGAGISAAPVTAAEVDAQRKEADKERRSRRDEEREAEKEDAARNLEEEFEEMDALEQRVKKMKELREKLKAGQKIEMNGVASIEGLDDQEDVNGVPKAYEYEDDDEDDEDDEDLDDWGFGRT